MEKYIFLDFDGVLNTPKGKFDQKAIGKLRRLLERCDAKVIISSTWRLHGVEYIRQLWKEALYIFMVILFMSFVYWYPGEKVMNTNRHFLMIQNSLHQYHFPWQK